MFAHSPLNHWLLILFCSDVRHNIISPTTTQRYAKKPTGKTVAPGAELS